MEKSLEKFLDKIVPGESSYSLFYPYPDTHLFCRNKYIVMHQNLKLVNNYLWGFLRISILFVVLTLNSRKNFHKCAYQMGKKTRKLIFIKCLSDTLFNGNIKNFTPRKNHTMNPNQCVGIIIMSCV